MATAPIAPPLTMLARDQGEVSLSLVAPALTPVRAPASGTIVYVGPGTEVPWDGNGPAVVVLMADPPTATAPATLHVLGYLDEPQARLLWSIGMGEWGYATGVTPGPALWGPLADKGHPRPRVREGQTIGYVSPARGALRWSTWRAGSSWSAIVDDWAVLVARVSDPASYGPELLDALYAHGWERTDPIDWLTEHGIRAPSLPAPAPAPTSGGNGAWVLLACFAGGLLLLGGRRKRRRNRR